MSVESTPPLTGDWYLEEETFGYRQGVRVQSRLLHHQSPYQKQEIFETELFGRCLVLDNALQTSEWDEFMYHEMLVHVPLMSHPTAERVLIIGGGDGGALRRVLEHPATRPTQVEIDASVIENCRKLLPGISNGAYDNSRASVVVGDGFEYMRGHQSEFDVVLIDSTDPVGPAIPLFQEPFYRDVYNALGEDGLMAAQSNSPIYMVDQMKAQLENLRAVFPIVRTYLGLVPAYPGGLWSYTIASKRHDPAQVAVADIESRLAERGITTRYYSPRVHQAAFVLPGFIAEIVG